MTAVKEALKKKGFEIQGFAVNRDEERANAVDARHPEDHQFVSVASVGKDLLVFVVNTPCLLPPGVDQQRF